MNLSLTQSTQFLSISRLGGLILAGVVLVKMGISQESIGLLELLFFLGYSMTTFWVNALNRAMLPLYSDSQKTGRPNDFFWTTGLVYIVGASLLWVLLSLFKGPFTELFLKSPNIPYYDDYVLYLCLSIPGIFLEQYFTLRENKKSLLSYTILTYVFYPLYFLVPNWLGWSLAGIFHVLSVVAILRLVWVIIELLSSKGYFDKSILSQFLRTGSHFMWLIIAGLMAVVFDGWLINYYYQDPEIFAIFRYGAREMPLTTALTAGLSLASVSKLAIDSKAYLPTFKSSWRRILIITWPVSILLLLTSKWLFPVVFSEEFAESAIVFNVYLLVLGSRVLMPGTLLMAKGDSRIMARISIFELSVNIGLSIILIRYWGYLGVAAATVIAFYIEKIAYFWRLKHHHGIAIKDVMDIRLYLLFFVSLHLVFLLTLM